MPFFSILKKAKKDADLEKKATEHTAGTDETKPKPTPLKHASVHAVQDALPATSKKWSPQETRARIANARNRKSRMSISTYATACHSRPKSELSLPISPISRSKNDLSIATMMGQPPSLRQSSPMNYYSSPIPPVPPIPPQHRPKPSDEPHAFSTPRDAPQPPLQTQSPSGSHHSTQSIFSTTRASSPPSSVSVEAGV